MMMTNFLIARPSISLKIIRFHDIDDFIIRCQILTFFDQTFSTTAQLKKETTPVAPFFFSQFSSWQFVKSFCRI